MRCHACGRWSLALLCSGCRRALLTPSVHKRTIDGLEIVSFYPYSDLEPLLFTKHTVLGHGLYHLIAHHALTPFARAFHLPNPLSVLPIDDRLRGDYAHTAILAHALTSASLRPLYGTLHAQSSVTYAGQNLAFRKANPRNFRYTGPALLEALLIDDIVTTGTTLLEARDTLARHGITVPFALTLADAAH